MSIDEPSQEYPCSFCQDGNSYVHWRRTCKEAEAKLEIAKEALKKYSRSAIGATAQAALEEIGD